MILFLAGCVLQYDVIDTLSLTGAETWLWLAKLRKEDILQLQALTTDDRTPGLNILSPELNKYNLKPDISE